MSDIFAPHTAVTALRLLRCFLGKKNMRNGHIAVFILFLIFTASCKSETEKGRDEAYKYIEKLGKEVEHMRLKVERETLHMELEKSEENAKKHKKEAEENNKKLDNNQKQ
jgi:hypothetical protein